ncbi:hypothetical protein BHE74_00002251 [Ensete ventricosum]|nr:hypothetical protein GW17_00009229 [Ensete ventricosum]RWW88856.1 hypothetical protein BHE74_00002251 [Ensete ventricosum]
MLWELIGSSLGVCRRNREAYWEHVKRSPEEDHKTHRKMLEATELAGANGCTIATQYSELISTVEQLAPAVVPPIPDFLSATDLEAYTMTSEETINAKFEAFESRMEEKIQSLFAEFSMGRPPSPKKSQQGETSYQRDDPQEHGHIIFNPNTSCMKVDFPRWEEGDPIRWIAHAE